MVSESALSIQCQRSDNLNFFFYNPVFFEQWDYRSSIIRGVGGSETSAVEMAWRLARRGHKVTSYAPIPDDCPGEWRGTVWKPLESADFTQKGIWIIYRDASCLTQMDKQEGQTVWLMCQDEIARGVTEETAPKIDKVLALCEWHKRHMELNLPLLKGKIVVTSNGVKTDLLRSVPAQDRNSHRLMYASSPDRGLQTLLRIFPRVREFVSDAELHIFYGFNNIEKLKDRYPWMGEVQKSIEGQLEQRGIHWHGRVNQNELYREWMKSAIWCYPTNFHETSCITSMEAQALGAIPICSPRAALAENVLNGVFIQGDPNDQLIRAYFVGEIVALMNNPNAQEEIRGRMMVEARSRHCWERVVDQWESWLYGWDGLCVAQFAFQLKHLRGMVLNVGCADDPANIGRHGTNMDLMEEIPWTGKKTKADVIHDAREPFPVTSYDTVVLGDILEHMTDEDAVRVLRNSSLVLNPNGRIIITCPEDYRPTSLQHSTEGLRYPPGESAYHERPITLSVIESWLRDADLELVESQELDYGNFAGWGVVARARMAP